MSKSCIAITLKESYIEDLRVDAGEQLLYVLGKGRKQRWVPLYRAAIAAVRLYLRCRDNPTRGP